MLISFETDRLLLRPRSMVDHADCLAMDSQLGVMRYVGGVPENLDEHGRWLASRISRSYPTGLGYWSLFAKPDPKRLLGWVSLLPLKENDPASDVEVGWRVAGLMWGKGYAPEAVSVILRYALQTLCLERVIATIHPENTQSVRVAEKCGMLLVGAGDYFGQPCKLYEIRRQYP